MRAPTRVTSGPPDWVRCYRPKAAAAKRYPVGDAGECNATERLRSRVPLGVVAAAGAERLCHARHDRLIAGMEPRRIGDHEAVDDLAAVREQVALVEFVGAARAGEHEPVRPAVARGDLFVGFTILER